MMKIRTLAILVAAAIAAIGFIFWRECVYKPGRFGEAESRLAPVFKKHGLTDDAVISRYSVKKRSGRSVYFHTEAEYDAPKGFLWKAFLEDARSALGKTQFSLTSPNQVSRKTREVYTATVSRGGLSVMDLKISRRIPAVAHIPLAPKRERPKVAIVIDDFGYNMNNVDAFFRLNEPITLSILPQQPYSREIARMARSRGHEVMLHLPLESWRSDVKEESSTIRSGMTEKEVDARIAKELAYIPGAGGVSNHMGSKATEDDKLMVFVMRYLKKRGLYYFDSLTSPKSVCRDVASGLGVRCGRRDRFLDNSSDMASIEEELVQLRDTAFARGRAIAVCHDRKNTVAALSHMMPEMSRDGVEFVYLSDLIN
jgi:polysaccharide deacetylase 2 family uncharacterized protein YibQ